VLVTQLRLKFLPLVIGLIKAAPQAGDLLLELCTLRFTLLCRVLGALTLAVHAFQASLPIFVRSFRCVDNFAQLFDLRVRFV
jgi:hypothetical protein